MKMIKVESKAEHVSFLYERLKGRIHSISHKELPDLNEHKSFVENHPYRHWFLLKIDKNLLGSIYIHHDNSIGIDIETHHYHEYLQDIFKTINRKIKPLPELKSVRPNFFFVNVAMSNKDLMLALEKLGFVATQKSYVQKIKNKNKITN